MRDPSRGTSAARGLGCHAVPPAADRLRCLGGVPRAAQENLERILADDELRSAFDSIHICDVMENAWCVSMQKGEPRASSLDAAARGGAAANDG